MNNLPATGFLRLPQILGNPKSDPPIPALVPVSRSAWWAGVRAGRFPAAIKLGARTTAWRAEDIRALIARIGGGADPSARAKETQSGPARGA